MKMRTIGAIGFGLAIAAGCKPKAEPPSNAADSAPAPTPVTAAAFLDREWALVQLGDNSAPMGNGGKPVTLTLQSADNRAFGNAGCNRYSGPYTLAGDQLTFGPAISTKMACNEGMDVENAFLAMLPSVKSYTATDTSLTLVGDSGPLARFARGTAP
jgi:heat shock protein HslJ